MEQIICKHFYSDLDSNHISEISFDIFLDLNELYNAVTLAYRLYCFQFHLKFDESNILVYRCGSVSQLGEFRIYSNPLPIYLKDIKETIKND